jgi:hypothetical protein
MHGAESSALVIKVPNLMLDLLFRRVKIEDDNGNDEDRNRRENPPHERRL